MQTKDARKSLAAIEDSDSRTQTDAIELAPLAIASSRRVLIQPTYFFAVVWCLFRLVKKATKESLGSSGQTLMQLSDDVACGFLEQTGY